MVTPGPVPAWPGMSPGGLVPATAGKRIGAALIDLLIIGIGCPVAAGIVLSSIGTTAHDAPTAPHRLIYLAIDVAMLTFPLPIYFLVGWRRGATPGMAALHLKVRSVNGGRPSGGQLLLRLACAFWSTVLLFFGFFWAGIDSRRRTWHDILSGTVVESAPPWQVYGAYAASVASPTAYPSPYPGYPPPLGYPPPPGYPPPGAYPPMPPEAATPPLMSPAAAGPVEPAGDADEGASRAWRNLVTMKRSPWTWTDVVPLVVLFVPLLQGTGWVISWLRRQVQPHAPTGIVRGLELILIELLVYSGVGLLLFLLVKVRRHASLRDLGLGRVSPRWMVAALPALVGGYCLVAFGGAISQLLFPGVTNNQCVAINDEFGGYPWVAIIIVAVMAPLVEETIYRGFLLRYLRDRMPRGAALILSAAIFSASHFAWGQPTLFLPVFMIGLVLGTLYLYSGSIWPGVIVHGSFNLVSTLVLLSGIQHC